MDTQSQGDTEPAEKVSNLICVESHTGLPRAGEEKLVVKAPLGWWHLQKAGWMSSSPPFSVETHEGEGEKSKIIIQVGRSAEIKPTRQWFLSYLWCHSLDPCACKCILQGRNEIWEWVGKKPDKWP